MKDLPIQYRVEKAFLGELKARVPEVKTWLMSQDNPTGEPPYGIIQCDEAKETTPESGVFYVATAILVTTVLNADDGTEHAKLVQAVKKALNEIPKQGEDAENGVKVYGFYVQRSTMANVDQEQGTLFELQIGCGVLERPVTGHVEDKPL